VATCIYAPSTLSNSTRDLRFEPLAERLWLLARLVRKPRSGRVLNGQFDEHGPLVFEHAYPLGCEASCPSGKIRVTVLAAHAIGSRPRNPATPAVKREAEED
jgi:hypothetical protein